MSALKHFSNYLLFILLALLWHLEASAEICFGRQCSCSKWGKCLLPKFHYWNWYGKVWEKRKLGFWSLLFISHVFSLNYSSYLFPVISSSFDYPTSLQASPLNIFQFQFFYKTEYIYIYIYNWINSFSIYSLKMFDFILFYSVPLAIPNFLHQSQNRWMQISTWKNIV